MKARAAILIVFLLAVAGIVAGTLLSQGALTGAGGGGGGAAPAPDAAAVKISMLYSTEKKDWVEASYAEFQKAHPEIVVELQAMGSFQAAEALVDGSQKPTVFSPADSLALNLFADDWDAKYHRTPFSGMAPEPLVITPLVFAAWEDRGDLLVKAGGGHVNWKPLHDALGDNRGWPAIGGPSDWGFVKLGQTDPTRSNSGLQALALMTMDFYDRPSLTVADVLDPAYQKWVGEIEAAVPKFETSTGTFMTDMVRFGPSKYDVAIVYESVAIGEIEHAQGRWGNLHVYYPARTMWSDHPAAVLTEGVTPEQAAAAKVWLDWLRSPDMQQKALLYGFRPGNPAVAIQTTDASNPFVKYAQYGVQLEIPPVASTPDASVVRNLMTMWTRVVPRR